MKFHAARNPCGCRAVGECMHRFGPSHNASRRALRKLVRAFADEMESKLIAKLDKGNEGWDDEEWSIDDIVVALREHIDKGDPVDVANFAAFWWNRLEIED